MLHNKIDLRNITLSKMSISPDVSGGNGDTNNTAAYKLQDYLNSFSTMPTMDQYRPKEEYGNPWKPGKYEVELDERTVTDLADSKKLKAIWKLYNPGDKK